MEELLAFQVRLTLWLGVDPVPPVEVPVPDKASFSEELLALLAKDAVADAAPALWGLKVSVKDVVLPAAIVTGNLIPLITYSALFVPAEEIVTLDPLALNVPIALLLDPTAKLPKLMLVGVTASVPVEMPVPESGIDNMGALLDTAIDPVTLPLLLGAKTT
jgi:hypothetical protein